MFPGADGAVGSGRVTASLVVAIAFIKVWLVGDYFMELRVALPRLRLAFGLWVLTVAGACTALYF